MKHFANLFTMPAAVFTHLLIATAATGILLNFYACNLFEPSEKEMSSETQVTRKTNLNRLGISYVQLDRTIKVIVTNVIPRRFTLRDDPAPVLGIKFSTSGVHLVLESPHMRRQVPLVSSGTLQIWDMQIEHLHESIRVILEVTHFAEDDAR